ncbi:MAG: hypothetical protein ACOC90_04250, partial [Bacteroidota bacterium]
MTTHIRAIEKLLSEIERESDQEKRREKIQWLFKSEWRPEYIAGAIALGKYARLCADKKLENMMLEIINGYVPNKKGNIHQYRHALIALPAYLGPDHPGMRKVLDWTAFCDAMHEAYNERISLDQVCRDYPDLFTEWIQERLIQLRKEKEKAKSELERFKNDPTRQKAAIKSKSDIIKECEGIEEICTRFDQGLLNADYLKALIPNDNNTSCLPGYAALKISINPYNPENGDQIRLPLKDFWSRVSLIAGISEAFTDIGQFLTYATRIIERSKQNSNEIELMLNVPFMVARFWVVYHDQMVPYKNHAEDIIHECEKVFPFFKASSFDAINFLMDLVEMKYVTTKGSPQKSDIRKVCQDSACILSSYLQKVSELDVNVKALQEAGGKGDQAAFFEIYRQIAYQLKQTMESRDGWNLQNNLAQKAYMILAGWHFLYSPSAVAGKSGLLRIERRIHLAVETLKKTPNANDEELVQFFIRLVKELYYQLNQGSLKQGKKQTVERHYILVQFVTLIDMLNEWGWDFMIPKDLGTIMGNLLEMAWLQENDASLALWLAVMGEYAHIDLDVYRIGRDFVRVEKVKKYLGHMIAAEKDILGMNQGEQKKYHEEYIKALNCADPEQEPIYSKLVDFLALRGELRHKQDDWQEKYAEGLGSWRIYMKKYMFINVGKTFYERHGFELLMKIREKKTAVEQEYQEFQHAQEIVLDQQIAYLERLMLDIARLVGRTRNHDIHQLKERQGALRELQDILAEYKAWINQNLPYTMKYVILSRVGQLIQDVENHREVNGMLVNALNQGDEEQLNQLNDIIDRKSKWRNNYFGVTYARIYKDMVFQARNQILRDQNDDNAEKKVLAEYKWLFAEYGQMLSEKAGKKRQDKSFAEKDLISPAVVEKIMKENEQWMYVRFMFKEMAETYAETYKKTAKQHSMQLRVLGWKLYKSLLLFPVVIFLVLSPYILYAGITAINTQTAVNLPSWVEGVGFIFFLAIDVSLIILLVLGAGILAIKALSRTIRQNSTDTNSGSQGGEGRYLKNKLYSPINMFIPKVLGLMFVAMGGIIATTEGWEISIHARTPIMILSICLFASIIYIFIRQELLKSYPISNKLKSRRASNLFS